ncbi:STAS domain-containing protein [Oryzobacter telluris]|uniref:STAS domain-containing protein n=1 Tax=Oryzobacter telluris TaxID=3149179 RepID=UPI00370D6EA8
MRTVAARTASRSRTSTTLRTRHRDAGDAWVLELSGEADITTVHLLTRELDRLVDRHPRRVVVELADLTFCDVRSASLILQMAHTVPVELSGAAGPVKRVLDLLLPVERPPGGRVLTDVSAVS